MSGSLQPPKTATPATPAQIAQGAILKTSGKERIEGREVMRIRDGDLDTSDVVRDLLTYSLFTWRRASDDDDVPEGASRQGWFGDGDMGSRLWLLRNRALTPETLVDARQYAEEALAWMVDDGILSRVVVATSRIEGMRGGLVIDIEYQRPGGPTERARFDPIWGT